MPWRPRAGVPGIAVIRVSGPAGASRRRRRWPGGRPRPRTRERCGGCAIRRPASGSTRRWCSPFPGRGASPARTSSSCRCMAARRSAGRCSAALAGIAGLRLAEPGEFTRRALIERPARPGAGRGARRPARRRDRGAAAAGAAADGRGAVAARRRTGARELIRRAGLVEATIDFADEELPDGPLAPRRGRGSRRSPAAMERELARQPDRRADPRRLRGGAGRAAERRQVDAAERAGRPRGGADLGGRRDDARRDRGADGPRRAAGDAARHGGAARGRRADRGARDRAGAARGPRRPTCGCSCVERRGASRGRSACRCSAGDLVVLAKADLRPRRTGWRCPG